MQDKNAQMFLDFRKRRWAKQHPSDRRALTTLLEGAKALRLLGIPSKTQTSSLICKEPRSGQWQMSLSELNLLDSPSSETWNVISSNPHKMQNPLSLRVTPAICHCRRFHGVWAAKSLFYWLEHTFVVSTVCVKKPLFLARDKGTVCQKNGFFCCDFLVHFCFLLCIWFRERGFGLHLRHHLELREVLSLVRDAWDRKTLQRRAWM